MPVNTAPRIVVALLAAVALVVSLASCATPAPEPTPDPATWVDVCATPTGAAVESVTVSGQFGSEPDVSFTPGLAAEGTQRVVLSAGDGATVEEGSTVTVAYSLYRGNTGELIETEGFTGIGAVPLVADTANLMPGLLKTLGCVNSGSRVVSTITPSDAFGDQGFSNDSFTIDPGETLVVVMDVVRVLDRAWGVDEPATEGMPDVTLIAGGEPVVTVPDGAPPTELQIAVLKRGDGEVVAEGSTVLVHYHGVSWDTREVFDSSWTRGQAATFSLDGVVKGFAAAIAGQTIGSQVIAVIPPELAYGTDPAAHALGGQTLVFVVDILFAVAPDA